MAKTTKTLVWNEISVSDNKALAPLYAAVQKAQAHLADVKAKFEPELVKLLVAKNLAVHNDEDVVRVGYNFGKLSYAQDKKSGNGPSKKAISL